MFLPWPGEIPSNYWSNENKTVTLCGKSWVQKRFVPGKWRQKVGYNLIIFQKLTYLTNAVRVLYILDRSFNKVSTQLPDGRAVCTNSWKNVTSVPSCMTMAFSMRRFGGTAWEEASEEKWNWCSSSYFPVNSKGDLNHGLIYILLAVQSLPGAILSDRVSWFTELLILVINQSTSSRTFSAWLRTSNCEKKRMCGMVHIAGAITSVTSTGTLQARGQKPTVTDSSDGRWSWVVSHGSHQHLHRQ